MPKRFTEIEKWNDPWFCELKPLQKLVFFYLIERCDNAGFMEINSRIGSFMIGVTEDQFMKAINSLSKCFIFSKDKKKLWLVNYLNHQKNLPLNPSNNYHKQILIILNRNINNFQYDFSKLGADQGLFSPLGIGIGIGIGIGNGMEGGTGGTFTIEHCLEVSLKDSRWAKANKTNSGELETFNEYLERLGNYSMNIIDYKSYFAKLKGKYPTLLTEKAKNISFEELKKMAEKLDNEKQKL